MHYITKINNDSGKSKIKFDSMGVILMGLSSLHAAYGPVAVDKTDTHNVIVHRPTTWRCS